MLRFLFVSVILPAFAACASAGNVPGQFVVSGRVQFPDSLIYPYDVMLKNESKTIAGGTFNKASFVLSAESVPSSVEVKAHGFSNAVNMIDKSNSFLRGDTLYLTEPLVVRYGARTLDELTVTAQKVTIKEEGLNYTVSNIRGSDLADAGTILDMMAWVPGLTLDIAENIQVFGVAGTPVVYINDTPLTDKSKLASLPSNMVKKIEIIRAPGAEYPSGTTSVVKITTAVPLKDMMNANIIEKASQRRRFSNNVTANAFGSFGKFDFSVSAGYYAGDSRQSSLATETIYSKDGTLLRDVSTYQKDLIHTERPTWLAGLTYHLTTNDALQIEYSGNTSSQRRDFISELTTVTGGKTELTEYDSRNCSKPANHSLLAQYSHDFGNSDISVTATYNRKHSNNREGVYLMPENVLSEDNRAESTGDMWTVKSDYSWKFMKKHTQNIGIYGGRSTSDRDAAYSFTGEQNVTSSVAWGEFYYSSSWIISGFDFKPGIRFRYEKQKSESTIAGSRSKYSESYFNAVPQISVFHRFSKKFAMNVYYKYDYSLPSFSELSPELSLSDLIYYNTGNPDLKIPRQHNLALSVNIPSVTISAEYTSLRNNIVEITTPIENSEYFLVKPVNMDGNNYFTLQGSYNKNFSGKLRLYTSLLLRHSHSEYYYLDQLQKKNSLFAMVYLNASYNILPNFSVFASGFYASPQLVDNDDVGYSCDISFGANLQLFKSILSLRLAVNDLPARSVTPYWTSYSPNLYRTRRNYYDTRGVTLTATYRFTLIKKKYSGIDNPDDYYRM